ncbi:uroporphyrinogen decarboxylase family protein [Pelagibacteraceae bacterium]|jgi:uroporphyrinogen decarboxylase|nr:uroporphyrinogen decarboxylase [Pelagibacteraceae bacterium]MDC0952252.1 uroporphyrinogen decarboxylase family protein [Pelagibacteraceae bacterium]
MSNLKEILLNKKICKSLWFMRQAGRYLPEFQKIRKENPDFINLCLNSELSSELTLQPINRFDLDSAIIFSDILLVPYALGQNVEFIKNKGPHLSDFNLEKLLDNDKISFTQKLYPIYKAIELTRKKLDKNKTLISFVGAPWTLIIYMLNLKKNKNEINSEKIKSEDFKVNLILDKLNEYLCVHIENQINAGADIVQIFDSWAGILHEKNLPNYCYIPNLKIVDYCKANRIPSICFPRGIGENYKEFNNIVKPDGLNLDYEIDPLWARQHLKDVVLQGGPDPKILLLNDDEIEKNIGKYLSIFRDTPYVFNLGHGLLPETDPNKVGKLIKFYRNY